MKNWFLNAYMDFVVLGAFVGGEVAVFYSSPLDLILCQSPLCYNTLNAVNIVQRALLGCVAGAAGACVVAGAV